MIWFAFAVCIIIMVFATVCFVLAYVKGGTEDEH